MKCGVRVTPKYISSNKENFSSLVFAGLLLVTGCSVISSSQVAHEGLWTRQYFNLPGTAGNAYLDVRPADEFLAKYEYRLDVKFGDRDFQVKPAMQSSGAPNLMLELVEPSKKTGPFIRIIHDARSFDGPKVELLDLNTGRVFPVTDAPSAPTAVDLANAKVSPLGYLDANCNFALPDGSLARQDTIDPGSP
jgi:hypothetical protein